ncbi:MAG: phosphate/phosphite/phosphonate ABC transporter substrate-binding protein [Planctomycetota bacterium]
MRLATTTALFALIAAQALAQLPVPVHTPDKAPRQQHPMRRVLTLGVYTTDKPSTMYEQFNPMTRALEKQLEQRMPWPVEVRLQIFKTYEECQDALVQDKVDFVRFGPASYVIAQRKNAKLQLLAMESNEGKKTFKGYIVVRKDSDIQSLEDLAGRSFAFGDESSTIGRYLSQARLLEAGIDARKLARYEYLGRHDKVYRAVAVGDYDAGALKSSTFEKLDKKKCELRILVAFDNITKPWIARAGLDPKLTAALRDSLLAIDANRDPAHRAGPAGPVGSTASSASDEMRVRPPGHEGQRAVLPKPRPESPRRARK